MPWGLRHWPDQSGYVVSSKAFGPAIGITSAPGRVRPASEVRRSRSFSVKMASSQSSKGARGRPSPADGPVIGQSDHRDEAAARTHGREGDIGSSLRLDARLSNDATVLVMLLAKVFAKSVPHAPTGSIGFKLQFSQPSYAPAGPGLRTIRANPADFSRFVAASHAPRIRS